jgi:hypothetical protein
VFLSDVTGKVIYKSSIDLKAGTNQLEFNFNVNSGIMLLKIISVKVDFGTSKVVFK